MLQPEFTLAKFLVIHTLPEVGQYMYQKAVRVNEALLRIPNSEETQMLMTTILMDLQEVAYLEGVIGHYLTRLEALHILNDSTEGTTIPEAKPPEPTTG